MTDWKPRNPMPEGNVYEDGSGEMFDSKEWERLVYSDADYLKVVNGMPIICTDIVWVNPEKKCLYLAWRAVHSEKGPWVFGGRQRRGETPREAARRLLKNEVGTDIHEDDLHFVQWAVILSKYRAQDPQNGGAHYVTFNYCYVANDELVATKAKSLEPKEYDLEHGIREYTRADLEAIDPKGPYGFNRTILIEQYERIFGD